MEDPRKNLSTARYSDGLKVDPWNVESRDTPTGVQVRPLDGLDWWPVFFPL